MMDSAGQPTNETVVYSKLVTTVVESVRRDSRELRRPTRIEIIDDENQLVSKDVFESILQRILKVERFADIKFLKASRDQIYGFSSDYLIPSYARLCIIIETENKTTAMTETVREDSRIYPRPTNIDTFFLPPYAWSSRETMAALADIQKDKDLADIQRFTAENGEIYLYSNRYLDKTRATRIVEADFEFEQNP